jgi:hypothetical protein
MGTNKLLSEYKLLYLPMYMSAIKLLLKTNWLSFEAHAE